MQIPRISIKDYTYHLPDEKIALQPLQERSAAKLLVYKNRQITDHRFPDLPELLDRDSFIVVNETKVIHARLIFHKPSGAAIEIFCLQPDKRYKEIHEALSRYGEVYWQCIIGNRKKWKNTAEPVSLQIDDTHTLYATIDTEDEHTTIVHFKWENPRLSFAEILNRAGRVPLPPYIKRDLNPDDEVRYQTVFAREEGSVAAPTASLHFTEDLLQQIKENGHHIAKVCLHVGAGTFMPVKEDDLSLHQMHEEWIHVGVAFLESWLTYIQEAPERQTVAIGTTACRTLESLYWLGVKIKTGIKVDWDEIGLDQWECYTLTQDYTPEESITALMEYMAQNGLHSLGTKTRLLIMPGYSFKCVDVLVTNFHQPESTLLLLVAAFCGEDYKKIYRHALDHHYRFLSYGDGSVLFKN